MDDHNPLPYTQEDSIECCSYTCVPPEAGRVDVVELYACVCACRLSSFKFIAGSCPRCPRSSLRTSATAHTNGGCSNPSTGPTEPRREESCLKTKARRKSSLGEQHTRCKLQRCLNSPAGAHLHPGTSCSRPLRSTVPHYGGSTGTWRAWLSKGSDGQAAVSHGHVRP